MRKLVRILAHEKDVIETYENSHIAELYKKVIKIRKMKKIGSINICKELGIDNWKIKKLIDHWIYYAKTPRSIKALEELKSMKLLPLRISKSPAFIQFIRTLGLRYADGCIGRKTPSKSFIFLMSFGKKVNAAKFCNDVKISWGIKLTPYRYEKDGTFSVLLPTSIARLMIALGSPVGNKTELDFRLPKWLFELPKDLKWEFIDGLFSGDGQAPRLREGYKSSESLVLSLNSEESIVEKFRDGFMMDLWKLLTMLGIDVMKPGIMNLKIFRKSDGKITRPIKILIRPRKENMINFLNNVPFRYARGAAVKREIVLQTLVGDIKSSV